MKFNYEITNTSKSVSLEMRVDMEDLPSIATAIQGFNVERFNYSNGFICILVNDVSFAEANLIYDNVANFKDVILLKECKEFWRAGYKLQAVKRVKEVKGLGLKEAKEYCDSWFDKWDDEKKSDDWPE
jgi:hypothetical protein